MRFCGRSRSHNRCSVDPTMGETHRNPTPSGATPGEALGEGIDLIIMTPGKSDQFRGKVLQPSGTPRKANRAPGKQIALCRSEERRVGKEGRYMWRTYT